MGLINMIKVNCKQSIYKPLKTYFMTGFHNSVLMRLKCIAESQTEILQLLRSNMSSVSGEDMEDIFPSPVNTKSQCPLLYFYDHSWSIFQKCYLTSLGGHNIGDTVRRILHKLGTNALWST